MNEKTACTTCTAMQTITGALYILAIFLTPAMILFAL